MQTFMVRSGTQQRGLNLLPNSDSIETTHLELRINSDFKSCLRVFFMRDLDS